MMRSFHAMMLACLGFLALQVMPARFCVIESLVAIPGIGNFSGDAASDAGCCGGCKTFGASEAPAHCCIALQQVIEPLSLPNPTEKIPAAAGVAALLTDSLSLPRPAGNREFCLRARSASPPLPHADRQATICVWTV